MNLQVRVSSWKGQNDALESWGGRMKNLKMRFSLGKTRHSIAKNLCDEANEKLKRKNQSVVDQLESRDAALALRDVRVDETSNKCRELGQQLRGAEGRCRNMALTMKNKQEMTRKAEDRVRELEALYNAVAEELKCAEEGATVASEIPVQVAVSTQTKVVEKEKAPSVDTQEAVQDSDHLLFGTIRHDAIWGTFPDGGYERKLLYTFMRCGRSHSNICSDFRLMSICSRTQDERADYWRRHGWVADEHIKNLPQVVMKRRSGYVDEKPELVRAICASSTGC